MINTGFNLEDSNAGSAASGAHARPQTLVRAWTGALQSLITASRLGAHSETYQQQRRDRLIALVHDLSSASGTAE